MFAYITTLFSLLLLGLKVDSVNSMSGVKGQVLKPVRSRDFIMGLAEEYRLFSYTYLITGTGCIRDMGFLVMS